ncbi:MAG: xanthine dehydrogenase family protein molybdopterin-binding subunit [Hyphomicrobiales bacterium]|nr:xanthine dehydrogenase family protein molybdopterin-binding subunit [Hyphomicrobiales bacterium]
MNAHLSRRAFLQSTGALVVAFGAADAGLAQAPGSAGAPGRVLDPARVDAYLALHPDGTMTIYCGKVDLGTGLRIAIPQMAAEELGIGLEKINLIEGDTALTPDQGTTAGSTGIARGGVQIRQAAATAREALQRMGAERLGLAPADVVATEGEVRPRNGGAGIGFGELIGDRQFALKLDAKAPLRNPDDYLLVGKPLRRPDIAAKVTGTHLYVHNLRVDGMLHGRIVRPPAVDAKLVSIDESSIAHIRGVRVVRIENFLGVVAEDEWDAVRASRALEANWETRDTLVGDEGLRQSMRAGPFESDEVLMKKGDARSTLASASDRLRSEFYWPVQTHGSMGPSCAVADVRDGKAMIWTASQGTHRFRFAFAHFLGLPEDAVRLIYLDGAGCYGMNGHDDAAADAALMSRALGRPVRVQWMREDEHRFDPKGPPQLLALEGALGSDGKIAAWRTEMWIPKATASLPNVPLLGPEAAGAKQPMGISTGLISQNASPPYGVKNVDVLAHWLKDAPLRPSNIRAPGKIANIFAVESFTDELAAKAREDSLAFRLNSLEDPRGIEVLKRAAALLGWQARPSPGPGGLGRGIAYVHYKDNENYVAIAMEVEVDRPTGAIHVRRVACAHDCGLMINPDGVRSQVEGNILQTLSRALFEEIKFDRKGVTSADWASYPILTYPDVPELLIDLVQRPHEPPLGAGEASAAPVAAALANAVHDACGIRLRTVPFTRERVRAALSGEGKSG